MAEGMLGPHTGPVAVGAWKYSTRVAVRSCEMFVWVYGEIKALWCGQHEYEVGMGEGRGAQQPRALSSCRESLRATLGSRENGRKRKSRTAC